jgi:Ras-related protein Rab-5C
VFDLSDLATLERCEYYVNRALEENIPKECVILVGNKDDVPHEHSNLGKDFADKYEVQYKECSAKEGTNIIEVFDELAARLVRSFGDGAQEDSDSKPKVNVKEGNRKCCGRA